MKVESLDTLRELLNIDRLRLQEELIGQPGLFARVAELHGIAWMDVSRAKLTLAKVEAALEQRIRLMLDEDRRTSGSGQWVMREEVIAAVHREQAWVDANERVIGAQSTLGQISAIKDAYIQRSQMLISLCGLTRQELAGLSTAIATDSRI